ncbi:MAG: non-homologous end-joining DNA ligase [Acidimicrobiia bacterium]|nr:non-homologous end-joining DNA ligase [Acidimicrobiia bacterium]
MIRFGTSGLPPETVSDEAFLDGLVEQGYGAYELGFTKGFPWKEKRCRQFGEEAAARDIAVSIHAPYFAVLTVQEEDKAKQCRAALEHTMKLGHELGSSVIVAHLGNRHSEDPEVLLDRIREHLDWIEPKVRHLGVGLGLETGGKASQFGSLGDIAVLASEYTFVRPVVDWAHVHAMSGGALTSREAFTSVIEFLRAEFPGWMIDPLHCQFTDNQFGDSGEIRHVPYGSGSLRIAPLVEAAAAAGLRMTIVSEAKEDSSDIAIHAEIKATLAAVRPADEPGRPLASGLVGFPDPVRVRGTAAKAEPMGLHRPLSLTNIDKPFFPEGYTKGDLIQYYSSVAPLLLPHLAGRAIVMSRYPDGIDGQTFYEKQAPGHQPDWMPLAAIHSSHRGEPIEFVMAPDRESLMWLANMGCIEIHPWLSTVDVVENPNFAVFDLDPAEGATWQQVVDAARLIEVALRGLGLIGYPKTTGSRGIHIHVPLDPVADYTRVRRFVDGVARLMVKANPADLTLEWDKPKRAGKVFIDVNQNVGGKTIASVYSVRPKPGAPVSAPLLWDELDDVQLSDFTIATVWERFVRYGDLFAPVLRGGQTIDAAEAALGLSSSPDD